MKLILWDSDKNIWLRDNRGICFEDIIHYIENDLLIDDIEHPNKKRYPNQRIMLFLIDEYLYLVPYIESEDEIFLKTIIPSRKATKKYFGEKNE
jgi:uncharacterized DUF497 family protein